MKQSLLVLLLSVASLFFTSCERNGHITQEEMTENVKIFIERIFPGSEFNKIRHAKDDKQGLNYYKIELIPYNYLEITTAAVWMKLENPDGIEQRVVNSLLALAPPYAASDIDPIKEAHPDMVVTKMEKNRYNDVYLELTGKEIYMLHNEFQKTTLYANIVTGDLPIGITQFVTTYLGGVAFQSIWKSVNENKYKAVVGDNITIGFDADGNWENIDADWKALPKTFYTALPQPIQNYIEEKHKGKDIYRVEADAAVYTLYFQREADVNTVVSLDAETASVISPLSTVQDFITEHFDDAVNKSFVESASYDDRKNIIYGYKIDIDDYKVTMSTDKQGNWTSIEVKDSNPDLYKAIPASIIKTLPAELKEILSTQHSSRTIWSIVKGEKIIVKVSDKTITY